MEIYSALQIINNHNNNIYHNSFWQIDCNFLWPSSNYFSYSFPVGMKYTKHNILMERVALVFIWDKLSYLLLKWQNEHQWISTSFSTILNTATFQYIISGWHAPTWFGQASVILAAQLRHCSQWWVYLRCLFVHSGVSEANAHFSEKLSCLSHLLWGGISTNDKCQV